MPAVISRRQRGPARLRHVRMHVDQARYQEPPAAIHELDVGLGGHRRGRPNEGDALAADEHRAHVRILVAHGDDRHVANQPRASSGWAWRGASEARDRQCDGKCDCNHSPHPVTRDGQLMIASPMACSIVCSPTTRVRDEGNWLTDACYTPTVCRDGVAAAGRTARRPAARIASVTWPRCIV